MKKSSWMLTAVALGGFASQGLAQEVKPMPAPVAVTSAPMILSSDCCNNCNACCDDGCGRGGSILAEIGFMILTPRWGGENPAVAQNRLVGLDTVTVTGFDFDSQFVPRLSLGFIGESGVGARINWFGFGLSDTSSFTGLGFPDATITAGPLGVFDVNFGDEDVLVTSAKLHMDVWDFEGVYNFGGNGTWSGLVAAGVRYAHISQNYNAVDIDEDGVDEALASGHNFNGAGPTVALQGRRSIGGGGLYAFGNLRGAVLFGKSKQSALLVEEDLDPVAYAETSYNSVIPVGELEIGAGFRREGRRFNLFAEAGFVGQAWGQVGNSSRSTVRSIPDELLQQDFAADDSTLGLLGFSLKLGLGY